MSLLARVTATRKRIIIRGVEVTWDGLHAHFRLEEVIVMTTLEDGAVVNLGLYEYEVPSELLWGWKFDCSRKWRYDHGNYTKVCLVVLWICTNVLITKAKTLDRCIRLLGP